MCIISNLQTPALILTRILVPWGPDLIPGQADLLPGKTDQKRGLKTSGQILSQYDHGGGIYFLHGWTNFLVILTQILRVMEPRNGSIWPHGTRVISDPEVFQQYDHISVTVNCPAIDQYRSSVCTV